MAYTKGKISIPNVTGNIVVTVTARQKAITNLADPSSAEWLSNHRITSGGLITTGQSQVTNLIPVAVGDIIRIKGGGSYTNMPQASFPDAAGTSGTPMTVSTQYDSASDVATFTINATAHAYARWSIPTAQIADVSAIIITRNEEIN